MRNYWGNVVIIADNARASLRKNALDALTEIRMAFAMPETVL